MPFEHIFVVGPNLDAVERVLHIYLYAVAHGASVGVDGNHQSPPRAERCGCRPLFARAPGVAVWRCAAVDLRCCRAAALRGTAVPLFGYAEHHIEIVEDLNGVVKKTSVGVGNLQMIHTRTQVASCGCRRTVVEPQKGV